MIDHEKQNQWILGGKLPGVGFAINQRVRVTSGPDAGTQGHSSAFTTLATTLYSQSRQTTAEIASSDSPSSNPFDEATQTI